MCGLVGMLGKLSNSDHKIFSQLLMADVFRGVDSTGVTAIKGGVATSYKRALTAADFVQLKGYNNLLQLNTSALLGHNRAATAGSVDDDNAHPFKHGDITLMHNGTLTDYDITGANRFDVDSEAVCYAISVDGWQAVLPKLEGAYVLIWHDASDNSVNFAGNSKREFCFAYAAGKVYWASEKHMLAWILDRNKIKVDEFYGLGSGKHLKIVLDNKPRVEVADWTVTKFEVAPDTPVKWNSYGGGSYYGKKHLPSTQVNGDTGKQSTTEHTNASYLSEYGLAIDQKVGVHFYSFEPFPQYSQNKAFARGTAEGFTEAGYPVISFGIEASVIGADNKGFMPDDAMYMCEAISVASNYEDAIVVRPSTVRVMGDNEWFIGKELVTEAEYDAALVMDCAFCGDIFTQQDLATAKYGFNGELMHDVCCDNCDEMMEA